MQLMVNFAAFDVYALWIKRS